MKGISNAKDGEPINSVWMMAHSGAWFSGANQTIGRHARFDGKAIWRDY